MPAKNHLTIEQKKKLLSALKTEDNPEIRTRILILLLLNDGKTQQEIANFLECSKNTVCYWCLHGEPDNLDSLKDERMKGNHRKATQEYIDILLETVEREPQELGYEFGRWTTLRLAVYLEEKTGIKLSSAQVRRILLKKKYVYLWAKHSLETRQNQPKREAFKKKLQSYFLIEKETPSRLQIWYWDEFGVGMRTIKRKNWCHRGKRRKIRGDRRKGRVNVMGALRNSDKKRFVDFVKKSNSKSFYEVMKIFYQEIINEWVSAGNKLEEFREKGPKIVIILDNASFHKKLEYIQKIKDAMPNIHLEYLPEYSPDYNLIELVWHLTKEYIAHRYFESIEELELVLHKLLNEGELSIHWGRTIKNKGNSIITF